MVIMKIISASSRIKHIIDLLNLFYRFSPPRVAASDIIGKAKQHYIKVEVDFSESNINLIDLKTNTIIFKYNSSQPDFK